MYTFLEIKLKINNKLIVLTLNTIFMTKYIIYNLKTFHSLFFNSTTYNTFTISFSVIFI